MQRMDKTGNLFVLLVVIGHFKGYPTSTGLEQTPLPQHGTLREHHESSGSMQPRIQYIQPTPNQQTMPVNQLQQQMPVQPNPQSLPVQSHQLSGPAQPYQQSLPVQTHQQSMPAQHFQHSIPDQQSMPAPTHQQSMPVENQHQAMPEKQFHQLIPVQEHQQSMPVQTHQQSMPVLAHQQSMPAQHYHQSIPDKQSIPAQTHQQSMPAQTHQQSMPAQTNQQSMPAQTHQQSMPAQTHQQPMPVETHQQSMPAQTRQQSMPAQTRQQSMPAQTRQQSMPKQQYQQPMHEQQYQQPMHEQQYQQPMHEQQYQQPMPLQQYQQSIPRQPSQQSIPRQPNQQSIPVQQHQPPISSQSQAPQPSLQTKPQMTSIPAQSHTPEYSSFPYKSQHPKQSLPPNHSEQKPSNYYHKQPEFQQPNHAQIPPAGPQHYQNDKASIPVSKPDYGYDTQVKQVANNLDTIPMPYMKYDKNESPVFHYGHDDLDVEYGDRKVHPGEFPYFVQLRTNGEQICGGALIRSPVTGKQVVLTALHCLVVPGTSKLLSPPEITLRMGVNGLNDYVEERKANAVLAHSGYHLSGPTKRPIFNDIGMVITDGEFNLNKNVQFIDLPEITLPTIWHDVNIKGFGKGREAGHMEPTKFMRTISVPVWDTDKCNKAYYEESGMYPITDAHFCAAHHNGGLDSCQGDSGGPVTAVEKGKLYLVGVVSWGKGCGKIAYPGVYVRVWSYLNWIKMTLFDYEINGVLPPPPEYPQ